MSAWIDSNRDPKRGGRGRKTAFKSARLTASRPTVSAKGPRKRKAGATAAGAKKWWLGELSREANNKGVSLEELPITPADVAEVEKLIADGKLNDKLAKQTVAGVLAGEGTPDEVVKKHGFQVVSDDGALEKAVDEALAANPDIVEKLKSGNMKPMGAIIGAVMRATRGQADAKAVTKIVMGKIK